MTMSMLNGVVDVLRSVGVVMMMMELIVIGLYWWLSLMTVIRGQLIAVGINWSNCLQSLNVVLFYLMALYLGHLTPMLLLRA